MAEQAGLDLAAITGTGPHGRIVKADVEAALTRRRRAARRRGRARPAADAGAGGARRRLQPAPGRALAGNPPYHRDAASARCAASSPGASTESKQTVPHYYLTIDCEIDALLAMRAEAQRRRPDAQALGQRFRHQGRGAGAARRCRRPTRRGPRTRSCARSAVDIAVAVALDDGLITPIIKNADQKGLAQISAEMQRPRRARQGGQAQARRSSRAAPSRSPISACTASRSSPPSSIRRRAASSRSAPASSAPVVKNGALAVATVMSCTLSCDHRVVDGAHRRAAGSGASSSSSRRRRRCCCEEAAMAETITI